MAGLGILALTAAAPVSAAVAVADAWAPRDYLALVGAIGTIVALVVSYFISAKTLKASQFNTEASIWQRSNEIEINQIQEQLDGFYGPFMQYSGTNLLLSRDLRDRQPDSETFLLIEKLFDREWLANIPAGEHAIVREMVQNARHLREFIAERARMVNLQIQPYLSRVTAPYRMIELAYDGELGDDPKPFVAKYVFPRPIDEVLELEVARLEARRNYLRAHPGKAPLSNGAQSGPPIGAQ